MEGVKRGVTTGMSVTTFAGASHDIHGHIRVFQTVPRPCLGRAQTVSSRAEVKKVRIAEKVVRTLFGLFSLTVSSLLLRLDSSAPLRG